MKFWRRSGDSSAGAEIPGKSGGRDELQPISQESANRQNAHGGQSPEAQPSQTEIYGCGLFLLVDQNDNDNDAVDIVALHGLNGHWKTTWQAPTRTGPFEAFYSSVHLIKDPPSRAGVVDEESAILGFPNEVTIPIHGNHRSMCRIGGIICFITDSSLGFVDDFPSGQEETDTEKVKVPDRSSYQLPKTQKGRGDVTSDPRAREENLLGLKPTDTEETPMPVFQLERFYEERRREEQRQETERRKKEIQELRLEMINPEALQSDSAEYAERMIYEHNKAREDVQSGRLLGEVRQREAKKRAKRIEAACREDLSSTDYESHRDRIPDAVPGTCQWLLHHQKYSDWRSKQASDMLWLSADPGCGKSVLISYLVDCLTRADNKVRVPEVVCYFFFKEDNEEQNNAVDAVRAILHQLYSAQPRLTKHAANTVIMHGEAMPRQFRALWSILMASVQDVNSRDVIILLDGLDECEPATRSQLLQSLTKFYTSDSESLNKVPYVKAIVASRPDNDIKICFDVLPTIRLRGEDQPEAISNDVELVIKHHIENAVLRGLPRGLLSDLEAGLIRGADRTFLWTTLVIDVLDAKRGASRRELLKILESRDIYRVYQRLLEDSPDQVEARRLLSIVVAAARPMTLAEMSVAAAVSHKQRSFDELELDIVHNFEERLKDLCGNFVRIIRSTIYLVHQTAREFLLRDENAGQLARGTFGIWQHSIILKEAHRELLNICLLYLPFLQIEVSTSPLDVDANSSIRFLDYAARYWTHHYSEVSPQLTDGQISACIRLCNARTPGFHRWFSIAVASARNRGHRIREGMAQRDIAFSLGLGEVVQAMDRFMNPVDLEVADESQTEDVLPGSRKIGSLRPPDVNGVSQPHTVTPSLLGESPLRMAMASASPLGTKPRKQEGPPRILKTPKTETAGGTEEAQYCNAIASVVPLGAPFSRACDRELLGEDEAEPPDPKTEASKATEGNLYGSDRQHANFYSVGLPSAPPPIPHQVTGGKPIQSGDGPESVNMSEIRGHALDLHNLEISHLLPPLSPPLQPIAEETPLEDGESSPEASLPLLGVDTKDLLKSMYLFVVWFESPQRLPQPDMTKGLAAEWRKVFPKLGAIPCPGDQYSRYWDDGVVSTGGIDDMSDDEEMTYYEPALDFDDYDSDWFILLSVETGMNFESLTGLVLLPFIEIIRDFVHDPVEVQSEPYIARVIDASDSFIDDMPAVIGGEDAATEKIHALQTYAFQIATRQRFVAGIILKGLSAALLMFAVATMVTAASVISSATAPISDTPCQVGFGSCEIASPPSCGGQSAYGRTIGYYQLANVRERQCNRISLDQTRAKDLTHPYAAFASINPNTFQAAIRGWTFNDPEPTRTTFSNLAMDPTRKARFITSLTSFLEQHGFDGVGLDWEYPAAPNRYGMPVDTDNYVVLPQKTEPYLDYFGVMSYDLHRPWSEDVRQVGPVVLGNTNVPEIANWTLPLYYDGVSPGKLNMGLAYYARSYTVADSSCKGVGCEWVGTSRLTPGTNFGGVMSLREIEHIIKELCISPRLLENDMIKELTFGNQWIGYNDLGTIEIKSPGSGNNPNGSGSENPGNPGGSQDDGSGTVYIDPSVWKKDSPETSPGFPSSRSSPALPSPSVSPTAARPRMLLFCSFPYLLNCVSPSLDFPDPGNPVLPPRPLRTPRPPAHRAPGAVPGSAQARRPPGERGARDGRTAVHARVWTAAADVAGAPAQWDDCGAAATAAEPLAGPGAAKPELRHRGGSLLR
ncbi:hypothetical protein DL771_010297 [Monosporascus sp. 5C6A]|nr:hypothetical protein DL771_010297 [Monosporascus sp. 5C6A]